MQKLEPVSFSDEEMQTLEGQLNVQERMQGTPKSIDPIKWPVFSIPVGKSVLVYVPKHITIDKEGKEVLQMDKPLLHSTQKGNQYQSYRCVNGLVKEGVLSGQCPLCVAANGDPWTLANKLIEQKCKMQGLNPEDKDNKDVQAIRSAQFANRLLKQASRSFTFPIVVIETKDDDGRTPVTDESTGSVKYKVCWYTISESLYDEKWKACFDSAEDVMTHPGGHFFTLKYSYATQNGKPMEIRDAARKFTVSLRRFKESEKLRAFFDEETEAWTPAMARKTIYANIIYPEATLENIADEVLIPTRQMLAMFSDDSTTLPVAQDTGFKLEKPADTAGSDAESSNAVSVETDEDGDLPLM